MNVKIIIQGNNIEISDAIRKFIIQKIGGLNKFLQRATPDLVEARVEVGKPSKHHRSGMVYYAEVNLSLPGKLLRAQAKHMKLRYAINEVRNKLERQIEKYKSFSRK